MFSVIIGSFPFIRSGRMRPGRDACGRVWNPYPTACVAAMLTSSPA